jgi:hypothetical protein
MPFHDVAVLLPGRVAISTRLWLQEAGEYGDLFLPAHEALRIPMSEVPKNG